MLIVINRICAIYFVAIILYYMQLAIAFCGFDMIIAEYHLQSKCVQLLIFQRMVKSHDKIKVGYASRTQYNIILLSQCNHYFNIWLLTRKAQLVLKALIKRDEFV